MTPICRGRLAAVSTAPARGERIDELVKIGPVVVNHILTGLLDAPAPYDQDHPELAIVLTGEATIEIAGEAMLLTSGDWLLLPAGIPHRLESAQPGTTWLTVHVGTEPGNVVRLPL